MDKNIYDEKSEVRSPPQERRRRRRARVRPPQQPTIPDGGVDPQSANSTQAPGGRTPAQPSSDPSQQTGSSHKQHLADARTAVAAQKRAGRARVKRARLLSRSPTYLSAKIPPGDWTRRARRRHLKDARREAAAEVASIKEEEAAKLEVARAALSTATGNSRLRRNGSAHLAEARVRSIRLGLIASLAGLAAIAQVAWRADEMTRPEFHIPLAAAGSVLLLLCAMPWKRLGGRPITSVLVFIWLGSLMGVMVAIAPYHEVTLGLFLASIWCILYAGVLLPLRGFVLAGVSIMSCFGWSVTAGPVVVSDTDLILYVAGLALTTLIVGITVHELRAQAVNTSERLSRLDSQSAALRSRERQLLQLYEVSRTIGAGEDMQQVLPELVARTAGYIGAKVGLVILHRAEEDELVALSPLWVAGQALEAEGYRFPTDGQSTAATVFGRELPHVRNSLTADDIARDQLLADLGVERVAAVPLQVEGRTIGVLLVADKAEDFTEADISALQLLSTPAGLVLNHVDRYQEAQETGRKMTELAQLKSDFVSVVSHELRTPLTSVIGALSTLARPELAPENPVAISLLESASSQARRLRNLIEDLLTVSKIDNSALPIRLENTSIGGVVRRLVERVPAWTEHVDLSISANEPDVAIDVDHFERVITNLLDNARKYAPDSRIEVAARSVDGEVWVSVIDRGDGIPFEYQQKVFERFTQIERPDTRARGGTGLGLSIVKDLTEAMQGRIWFEQTPGGGSTFTLAFPAATDPALGTGQPGSELLLVEPGRDGVESPINMNDLSRGGDSPVAE
ncbi:MAG: ATP-binding protein [Acidimicrobiia bacterium]